MCKYKILKVSCDHKDRIACMYFRTTDSPVPIQTN